MNETEDIRIFTGGMAATNAYVVQAPEGTILIDAPEDVAAWLLEEKIEVAALLLTHGHFDHVLDAARVKREHGCPVYCFEEITPDLTLEALTRMMGIEVAVEPVEAEAFLQGKDEVSVLGTTFRLLHVPGHSPDSVCFIPVDAEGDANGDSGAAIVFGGDVLFQGSIGRTDFPHSDHELLITGIREKLFPMADDTVVYPGHGPPTTIGMEKRMNPFCGG